ncbi:hypothetical protein FLA_5951 [Filimonas lacunae]|nr:hypothetical protein FLA_5951 [Filimonas lacunae]
MPLALLTACGGGPETKVLVIAKGTIEHNENNITVKDGSGYAQLEITVKGKDKNTITADGPNGKVSVDVTAPGYYVLSLRADTVVGAYQKLATSSTPHMSQEELKAKIDSLQQLTTGANVSAANHNYLVAPNQLVKVSDNGNARVYGPFHKVPDNIEPSADGKEVEIYKFSTNNEVRELVGKLSKLTQAEAPKQ